MTKEEFINKYGDVEVVFNYYYKYCFEFTGELPDGEIMVTVGGNSESIYRLAVGSLCRKIVKDLDIHEGSIYRNGVEIEGFYDY